MIQTQFKLEDNYPFIGKDYLVHKELLTEIVSKYPIAAYDVGTLTEQEFAKIRNKGFGASDSSVLLEVAYSGKGVPMMTIEELLYNKEHDIYNEEIAAKASVRKGKDLEALLLEKASKTLNAIIIKPTVMYTNNRGLTTNFDGIIFEPVIGSHIVTNIQAVPLEIKVCTMWARKNYNWNIGHCEFSYDPQFSIPKQVLPTVDKTLSLPEKIEQRAEKLGIPAYYYTQVQQQILFTGSDHGYLAVMDDSEWTMYYFYVPRDEECIKEIEKRAYTNYVILAKRKNLEIVYEELEGDI